MTSSLAPPHRRLYLRMAADAAALNPRPGPASASPVTEADLARLPAAAQRYLRFMEVPGRPPDWSFAAHFTGRSRLPWLRCQACQYSTAPVITRLYHMRLTAAGLLPMTGRNGRWQPRWGAAVWHLPDGPFCYAELRFTPGAARYNVTPAELSPYQQGSQLPGDDLIPGPAGASGSRP